MTNKFLKIGLDFDGVIADCSRLKFEFAKKLYNVEIPSKIFKEKIVVGRGIITHDQYRRLMNMVCGTREVGLRMRSLDGAIGCIDKMIKDGHNLVVITSREGSEIEVAREWIADFGLNIRFISVGYGQDKAAVATGLDVYIDDDVSKLISLVGIVPNLYLFNWDYNLESEVPEGIQRVASWKEIIEKIRKHY